MFERGRLVKINLVKYDTISQQRKYILPHTTFPPCVTRPSSLTLTYQQNNSTNGQCVKLFSKASFLRAQLGLSNAISED